MAGGVLRAVCCCVFFLWESIGWYVESKNDVKDRPMILK